MTPAPARSLKSVPRDHHRQRARKARLSVSIWTNASSTTPTIRSNTPPMRRAVESSQVRACIGEPQRIAYGPSAIETLDLYRTSRSNAPVAIFIHGGAWRARRATEFATPAELFVRAGAHFVMPDFAGVEDYGGDIGVVADQVQRAVAFICDKAGSFGGDPDRIYLFGHSSGAHLAGVIATTDWKTLGHPAGMFRGALLSSGMYELTPVRLSKR